MPAARRATDIVGEQAPISDRLREKFPPSKVYQREGPGGKKLDYVSGETILERLLDVAPEYEWVGRIVSIEDGRAVVEGTLTIPGAGSGFGVGSAKMGGDLDSSLKSANTEALKNAAKNCSGIGLELWNAEYRDDLARLRRLEGGSEQALKAEVFRIAKTKTDLGPRPTPTAIAKVFGRKAGDLADPDVLKQILTEEGVLS